MRDFLLFCLEHGVNSPSDLDPGRWVRCSTVDHPHKKGRSGNGNVKISEDGRIGWVINFATMEKAATWRAHGSNSTGDTEALKRLSAERFRERERLEKKAMADARRHYQSCLPLNGPTAYMQAKELDCTGCQDCRRTQAGALVVPMTIEQEIISTQTILEDGSKKFFSGAPVKGATFAMVRKNSTVHLLCEGFATGAALFSAVPEATVTVCFSAGNLVTVAQRKKLHGLVCVCADDDHETLSRIGRNPGLEAAAEAAKILGCGVAKPECSGSDWNDVFCDLLRRFKEDDMLSKFKKQPGQIRKNALARVKSFIMPSLKFVPYPETR